MATTPPSRTSAQRHEALKLANHVRAERAKSKQTVTRANIHKLLTSPPDHMRSMHVGALLKCIPYINVVKTNRILHSARTSPNKTLAGLTTRQTAAILKELLK